MKSKKKRFHVILKYENGMVLHAKGKRDKSKWTSRELMDNMSEYETIELGFPRQKIWMKGLRQIIIKKW